MSAPPPKPRFLIPLIALCVSLAAASTDIYLASMPSIARALAATVAEVQLTLAVFMIGFAFAQLVCGPLSDRFGRRPILLGGLAIYGAASVGCALATSIEMLIAWRLVQAIGGCAAPVVGRAVVRDLYDRDGVARALGYIGTVFALTPILAPIIGGQVEEWLGWRANFLLMGGLAAVTMIAVALHLPETNIRRDPRAIEPARLVANYAGLLGNRVYVGYALSGALAFGAIFSFISGSAFVFIDLLGASPSLFGFLFAMMSFGYGSGAFLSTRVNTRWGIDRVVIRAALLAVAGAVLLNALLAAGVFTMLTVALPVMMISFAAGLSLPNLQAGAIGPFPHMAGAASAMMGFTQMAGATAIGTLVGQFYDATPWPMTLAMAGASVGFLVLFHAVVWRRR